MRYGISQSLIESMSDADANALIVLCNDLENSAEAYNIRRAASDLRYRIKAVQFERETAKVDDRQIQLFCAAV